VGIALGAGFGVCAYSVHPRHHREAFNQQFALTIAISVILSASMRSRSARRSLVCCCDQNQEEGTHKHRGPLGKFFDAFNRYWERSTNGFVRWSHAVIRKGALVMVLLVLFGLGAFFLW